jgi:DtxR family Mn-dependent transcriptional regulator
LSISELNSNAEGIISFIRGSSELLDEISALNIKIGSHLSYEYNENRVGNHYLVVIDDEELNIPFEMANNIFIRI